MSLDCTALQAQSHRVNLDWLDEKSKRCRRERGFGFDYAARIFAGPIMERVDARAEYGEVRIQVLGEIDGLLFHVVYTDRHDANGNPVRWIISARRAHEKERRQWLRGRSPP